ncbi:hypothetical protein CYLTODRAFT_375924 [Cylindrobasidium torrendii FP15055 ss-10]|uniref:Transmembrane protein n=1 Tax=Cylindrobasidium torrendii FP15055 ss-10 TaxID=1314674 RepID=A0A0D7BB70_9AGAR|nr:hypothetical protein CYLTODRAFT_375924 [Cylindrobasidium torrendii FP15055 ss-10]
MSVQPTLWGMYWPTEKPYQPLSVSRGDMILASMAFGWTLGFGYFTALHCIRETKRSRRVNTYVILIWGELVTCITFAVLSWLYLNKDVQPSFHYFFWILTMWALQVQLLLQIIVNRLCILLSTKKERNLLRWSVAGFILAINISVYCIWLPAKLQISEKYHNINLIWDRCEKSIYLIVDAALNWYFIRTVKQRLVVHGGLKKYERLVRYNTQIIFVSLAMDVLIIAMMSLHNDFVYMQFHPVAYIVKLNIEMSMSNLIIKVARDTGIYVQEDSTEHSNSKSTSNVTRLGTTTVDLQVQVARQQFTVHDDIELSDAGWRNGNPDRDVKEPVSSESDSVIFPGPEKHV